MQVGNLFIFADINLYERDWGILFEFFFMQFAPKPESHV